MKTATDAQISRAIKWLESADTNANAEKAFRLLGLHWGRADRDEIENAANELLKEQRNDGGWSQLPTLSADAYATGLSLYALAETKTVNVEDDAYRNGTAFLMSTVEDDGSWHVVSRSFKFQPYFESGFPHGQDQWISAAATGWAATALMYGL